MKPDAKQKLNKLIWRGRLRSLLPIAIGLLLVVGIFAYLYWPDPRISERVVLGTVSNWTRPQTELGSGRAAITVLLEDGRTVLATSATNKAPQIGQSITLVEREFASGRITYTWNE